MTKKILTYAAAATALLGITGASIISCSSDSGKIKIWGGAGEATAKTAAEKISGEYGPADVDFTMNPDEKLIQTTLGTSKGNKLGAWAINGAADMKRYKDNALDISTWVEKALKSSDENIKKGAEKAKILIDTAAAQGFRGLKGSDSSVPGFNQDGVYLLPSNIQTVGVIVNKKGLLSKANIEIVYTKPATTDRTHHSWLAGFAADGKKLSSKQTLYAADLTGAEWRQLMDGLTKLLGGDKKAFAYELGAGGDWVYQHTMQNAITATFKTGSKDMMAKTAKEVSSSTKPADLMKDGFMFDNNFKTNLKYLLDSYKKYTSDTITPNESVPNLAKGNIFAMQNGDWMMGDITKANADVGKEVGFLPFPTLASEKNTINYGVGKYWMFNKKASDADLAKVFTFIHWLVLGDGKTKFANGLQWINPYSNEPFPQTNKLSVSAKDLKDADAWNAWTLGVQPFQWNHENKTMMDAVRNYQKSASANFDTLFNTIVQVFIDQVNSEKTS